MSRHFFDAMILVNVDGVMVPCDAAGNPWPSTPIEARWMLPKVQRIAIEKLEHKKQELERGK